MSTTGEQKKRKGSDAVQVRMGGGLMARLDEAVAAEQKTSPGKVSRASVMKRALEDWLADHGYAEPRA